MAARRLTRSEDRVIGGVAAGIADFFGVDPTLVRVVWVVAAIMGWGILAYVILWIVLPKGRAASHAIRIAEERFARGEIDAEELARIRQDLGGER